MKKQLMTGLFTVLALTAGAQTFQEWRNPEINAVNRAPMHTNYFAFENADAAKKADKKQSTNYMTLNGTWKFNWVRMQTPVRLISGKPASTTKAGMTCKFPPYGN